MWLRIIAVIAALMPAVTGAGIAAPLTADAVNRAELATPPAKAGKGPEAVVLKAQVLLDRAGFSPGVIDGHRGDNYRNALAAFRRENGLPGEGRLDQAAWAKLAATSAEPVLVEYVITPDDLRGPFVESIPSQLERKAELKRLAYTGPRELLAERFHMDEDLLQALNPKASFTTAGTTILVANVPEGWPKGKVARIEVRKTDRSLLAFDKDGKLVAFYPATVGSEQKPAPSGTFEVRAVAENPTYKYDPSFNFKGVKARKAFTVPPGPNNPVGAVWIDLTAETYGIHGTPEPSKIGKTESHGCVRLTNWDASALAKMVQKGTVVAFVE